MNEINNNKNKENQLIEEILKKSTAKEESEVLQSADTVPVKKDVKAMTAKQISTFKDGLKNLDFQYIGYVVRHTVKKKKLLSFSRLMLIFVVLPTVLSFIYFAFWASPMYISNTKFSVQSSKKSITGFDIGSLIGGNGGVSTHENFVVLEYLQSLALINEVDDELKIKEHYSSKDFDIISRLAQEPTNSELLKYWDFAVQSSLDTEGGIINVDVKAYTPDMAQKISEALLAKSERLVNELNARAQQDTVNLAEKELKIAIQKVEAAQKAMQKFREEHATFDPELTATGIQTRVEALQAEYTRIETELNLALSIMSKNAPQVKNLQNSLNAVKKQLEVENQKVVSNQPSDVTLSSVVAEYEALAMDLKFAKEQQVTAMKAFETARVQKLTQNSYLVCIQEPTFPDESLYPEIFLFTFYTFCGALIGLALVSLVVAAVREHAGF